MKGRELQEVRSKMGMTQADLAMALNISTRTVSRIESEDRTVPAVTVARLQDLRQDDGRSLAKVSTRRLAEELARRVALWDEGV